MPNAGWLAWIKPRLERGSRKSGLPRRPQAIELRISHLQSGDLTAQTRPILRPQSHSRTRSIYSSALLRPKTCLSTNIPECITFMMAQNDTIPQPLRSHITLNICRFSTGLFLPKPDIEIPTLSKISENDSALSCAKTRRLSAHQEQQRTARLW
jgi:hypothetical protein